MHRCCIVMLMISGGADTVSLPLSHQANVRYRWFRQTFGTMQGIFLALSLYPDVVKKAHAELDSVVGPHRLPDYADQESLVYINAIILEAMRWHVITPLSVPHRTCEDDELLGYFIPAGTTIIPNTWYITFLSTCTELEHSRLHPCRACLHDPSIFPDPEVFRPERFIRDGKLSTSGVHDPIKFVFGYGRRFVHPHLALGLCRLT